MKYKAKRKQTENVITLPENVTIDLGDREVILEKGDRVQVSLKKEKSLKEEMEGIQRYIEEAINSKKALGYYDQDVEISAYDVVSEFLDDECEYDPEENVYKFEGRDWQQYIFERADGATEIYNDALWDWARNTMGGGVEHYFQEFGEGLIDNNLTRTFMAAQQVCIESVAMLALNSLEDDGIVEGLN